MMRRAKFIFALAGLSISSFVLVLHVAACTTSNTVCRASGGCSSPCVNGTSGTSAILISASQVSQCSPSYMSTCSSNDGFNIGVCGVFYHYTGANCDSGTIDDSYPVFSSYCTPG
jgi:hypothetical protein